MGIRDFFARRLTGRVKVYKIDDFSIEPPETSRAVSKPQALSLKPQISCTSSRVRDFDELRAKMTAHAAKIKLSGFKAKAKNIKIKRYVKEDVKTHHHSFTRKPETFTMLKQIQALPQERANKLKIMKKRPDTARGEVLLACYGPIVEGSVLKLALNKQRGTLLVWYKAGSRQLKAKYVYLIRRLGLGEKPEWRWV